MGEHAADGRQQSAQPRRGKYGDVGRGGIHSRQGAGPTGSMTEQHIAAAEIGHPGVLDKLPEGVRERQGASIKDGVPALLRDIADAVKDFGFQARAW